MHRKNAGFELPGLNYLQIGNPMESCLGHSHKMMFPLKCIGKKQHQKMHIRGN